VRNRIDYLVDAWPVGDSDAYETWMTALFPMEVYRCSNWIPSVLPGSSA
jgi:hypothetical protein